MTVILVISLLLILACLVLVFWQQVTKKNKPLEKREFGYLKWVIYFLNILIVGLGVTLVMGVLLSVLDSLGLLEKLREVPLFAGQGDVKVSFEVVDQSLFANLVDGLNLVAVFGILVCMRAFMKNILLEDIFVPENVRLARLSTVFLILGSLMRTGKDSSSFIFHGQYGESSTEYSFFSLNYLLIAVLVWTLSIILEKAIAIAEENEFTI